MYEIYLKIRGGEGQHDVAEVLEPGDLVIDGGNALAARREAINVAESAARAGVQGLDEDAARAASGSDSNS